MNVEFEPAVVPNERDYCAAIDVECGKKGDEARGRLFFRICKVVSIPSAWAFSAACRRLLTLSFR